MSCTHPLKVGLTVIDDCCCKCEFQAEAHGHGQTPDGENSTGVVGYICTVFRHYDYEDAPFYFSHDEHGNCEMFENKNITVPENITIAKMTKIGNLKDCIDADKLSTTEKLEKP